MGHKIITHITITDNPYTIYYLESPTPMNTPEAKHMNIFEQLLLSLNRATVQNKTVFFRLLSVAQKAGLGLKEALNSILHSERNYGMQIIIQGLEKQINEGMSLAKSMEKFRYFFGNDEIELVRASESIGNMPDILLNIAAELENFQKTKGKVKSALTYPIVLLVFAIIAVAILLIKVIPTIVSLFPDESQLPGITKFVIASSEFVQSWRWIIGLIVVAGVAAFRFSYKKILLFKIFVDDLLLKIPALGDLIKTFYLYRFSKLLGDFYRAGVSPTTALEQISAIMGNYHYKKKVLDIRRDLEAGFGFSDSMEGSKLFDPILVQIVLVGERTGNIDTVLEKMAQFYNDMLDTRIKTLMGLLEPLLLAMVAVVIGVIVASIFLPMADMVNTIGANA